MARLTEMSRASPDPGMKHQVISLESSVAELETSLKAKDEEMYKLRDEKLRLEGESDRHAQEISTLRAMKQSQETSGGAGAGGDGAVADPGGGLEALIKRLEEDFATRSKQLREELQYARNKCDDKDKRIQQLAMDKSLLAVEVDTLREQSSPSDLESGRGSSIEMGSMTRRSGAKKSNGVIRSAVHMPISAPQWWQSLDQPLRQVTRMLMRSPTSRILLGFYFLILHVWVMIVLSMWASHHTTHGGTSSLASAKLGMFNKSS